MDYAGTVAALQRNRTLFESLLGAVGPEESVWRRAPDRWCLLEAVNHLIDEEVDDFRARVRYGLERPGEPWPQYNPVARAESGGYMKREIGESVARFLAERDRSLEWLSSLTPPPEALWSTVRPGRENAPPADRIRNGDVFVSWVAHDYFHIRQITEIRWLYLGSHAEPYSVAYAGDFDDR